MRTNTPLLARRRRQEVDPQLEVGERLVVDEDVVRSGLDHDLAVDHFPVRPLGDDPAVELLPSKNGYQPASPSSKLTVL